MEVKKPGYAQGSVRCQGALQGVGSVKRFKETIVLKSSGDQIISDLECWFKETDEGEPELSNNKIKAMHWGIFNWKSNTR